MSDWIAIASVVIAVVALVVAIRAEKKASIMSAKQLAIEEGRDSERRQEARQARLVPEIRLVGTSHKLFVRNDGMAAARDVVVMLDGEPFEAHRVALRAHQIPVEIGPTSEVSCLILITLSYAPPNHAKLTWTDDSGVPGSYEGGITL